MSKSTKRGRPPIANPKTASLHLRITAGQKEALYRLSKEKGISVTELILEALDIKTK